MEGEVMVVVVKRNSKHVCGDPIVGGILLQWEM